MPDDGNLRHFAIQACHAYSHALPYLHGYQISEAGRMFKKYPKSTALRGVMLAASMLLLGNWSAHSAQARVHATTPATPTGLRATPGNASTTLIWSASGGATRYHVKRSAISGGPYTQIAAPTATSYRDAPLTNGTTYYYVVSALRSGRESGNSAQVSVTPAGSAAIPAAPTGLAANPGNASVILRWSASAAATSYHVKRATTSGGPYTQIAAPTSTSFTDTTVSNSTTYFYVVSALDSAGESANSAQVSAAPVASNPVPAAPTGLAATAGNSLVALSWSASSGASSYHVKRATTSGGSYTQIGAPTSATYTDSSLSNGTAYYYVVSAVNSAGESANSAQVTATPTAAVAVNGVSVSGLHVSGNQILNSQNQAVALHGVNKSGTEYMCVGGPLVFDGPSDANSVAVLQSWAINIVRLPINEDCWLGINGAAVGGTAYQNAIIAYVNLLTAANISTIIELSIVAPGTTLASPQTPMPDADHASAFWTSAANTFKVNSSVIFDLFNEPYPDSNQDTAAAWACLKNGGTCPGVPYQAASMQSLVNAIRATGSTNVIMSPGVQYTNVLDQWLANKPTDASGNLVASWHSYANQVCGTQTCWDSMVKPVLQSVPLIAGEIGEGDCQDIYINPLMTYLDANGGNYLAWAWDTYSCTGFPSLISDYNGTPTAFGLGYRDHLLILDGQTPPN
jgi:fibronectin type 3 domain-containing protein